MTKVTKEEIYKIARISCIEVHESELSGLQQQLEEVLSYAERVNEVAKSLAQKPSNKSINVFREDVLIRTDSQQVLSQAPEREGDFFVVPAIISTKK